MTESEKINGWTFEETVKTATNLMEVENNMFKWDVLRHLRDFAEMYKEEVQRYRALGTVEELRLAKEKQIQKKPLNITKVKDGNKHVGLIGKCPCCNDIVDESNIVCDWGQKLDWGD